MKIRIEKAQCAGNACCAAVAPDLFALDDLRGAVHARVPSASS